MICIIAKTAKLVHTILVCNAEIKTNLIARELSMDSMRSLHSWLVVLSYLYLVESSSFSWIWSRRLSNLEQGLDSMCQNHTQSPPIGGATAGKRRAADVPAADQSGHGTEQGVRAKALIHLGRQSKLRPKKTNIFELVK